MGGTANIEWDQSCEAGDLTLLGAVDEAFMLKVSGKQKPLKEGKTYDIEEG
jgi:hypothetical protein